MKLRIPLSLFCVLAIVLTALAQVPAHESTIDGRWEAKVTTQRGEEITRFEFKNAGGQVSGTVTEGGAQPLVIKNGRLVATKLTFDTMQSPAGGGDPIMITWTGTVVGEGESIRLIRTTADGGVGRDFPELEAKRVP